MGPGGRTDEAVQFLRAALRAKLEVSTRLQLAGLLRRTGKIRETIDQYRQVLKVEPVNK